MADDQLARRGLYSCPIVSTLGNGGKHSSSKCNLYGVLGAFRNKSSHILLDSFSAEGSRDLH